MPTSKPTRLTRREFIKLSDATSLGIALTACGVTPTPTATPSLTETLQNLMKRIESSQQEES